MLSSDLGPGIGRAEDVECGEGRLGFGGGGREGEGDVWGLLLWSRVVGVDDRKIKKLGIALETQKKRRRQRVVGEDRDEGVC